MLELTQEIKKAINTQKQTDEFALVLETVCSNLVVVIDALEKWLSAYVYLILIDTQESIEQLWVISKWAICSKRIDSIISLANKYGNWNIIAWVAYEWKS